MTLKIVEGVAKTGAHALKIQTYTADTLTINKKDGDFFLGDKNSLWYGMSMYELYQKAHTPWEWRQSQSWEKWCPLLEMLNAKILFYKE